MKYFSLTNQKFSTNLLKSNKSDTKAKVFFSAYDRIFNLLSLRSRLNTISWIVWRDFIYSFLFLTLNII